MQFDDLLRTPVGRDLEKKVLNRIHVLVPSEPNAEPVRLSWADPGSSRHSPDAVRIAIAGHVQITLTSFLHDTDFRGQGGSRDPEDPTRG